LSKPSIADILAENGYITAGISASPVVGSGTAMDRGFRYFDQTCGKVSVWQNKNAGDLNKQVYTWLEQYDPETEPFFLYVHYMDPHNYYKPPKEFNIFGDRPYDSEDDRVNNILNNLAEKVGVAGITVDVLKQHGLSLESIKRLSDLYDGEVHAADHYIGELFKRLKARGLYDNTIIIVTSDHGECFLEHGNVKHGGSLYRELINVPLIIRIPGKNKKRVVKDLVEQIDILPTILDILKIQTPPGLSGQSFLGIIKGKPGTVDRKGMAQMPGKKIFAVRYQSWKLIFTPEGLELYNVAKDPKETKNLKDVNSSMVKELQTMFRSMMERFPSSGSEPMKANQKDIDMLKSLGYIQ
jgi:arylsulfatase A-like enzyme